MFLASNCTCAVYLTYTAHVPLLAKNMAATHVHLHTQSNNAFVAKIILCMFYSMVLDMYVILLLEMFTLY